MNEDNPLLIFFCVELIWSIFTLRASLNSRM